MLTHQTPRNRSRAHHSTRQHAALAIGRPLSQPGPAAMHPTTMKRPRSATLLRLIGLARAERGLLTWGMVLLLVGSASGLLYPQGMRVVIDTALGQVPAAVARLGLSPGALLGWAALGMVIVALLQSAAAAGRFYLFTIAGERPGTRLRGQVYRRILDQEVAFFDGERTGELMNRLSGDATVLQSAVSANISMALRNGVQALGGMVLLFVTSPVLAAMMLGVVPAIAISAVAYGRRGRPPAQPGPGPPAAAGR